MRAIYGPEGLQRVARGVASRLAGEGLGELAGQTPSERIEAVVQLFGGRGIVADWERDGDVFLLHERTCPFPEVARRNSISCAMEVAEVRLLTGMDARLQSCIVRGDECCTYRLSPFDAARTRSR